MSTASLTDLPEEILTSIAQYLDIATLLSLCGTSRRFRVVVNDPSIWRNICQRDYRYWESRRTFRSWLATPSTQNWKRIVIDRVTNSKAVQRSVRELVEDPVARSDRIHAITDGGCISKDALMRAFDVEIDSPNYLAQRYWVWVALGSLHRTTAIKEWDKIKFRNDVEDVTERALAALDMFILEQREVGDIDDIFDTLQSYAQAVRQTYPDIDEQTPRQKAVTIASYLREQKWIGLDNQNKYYSLDNMFLGVALFSSHHNSSPLLSSVIYCYVCRQFGLRAQPCSFPVHVHSIVQPPQGIDLDGNPASTDLTDTDEETLYMDPFNTIQPVPLSTLVQQLRFLGGNHSQETLKFTLQPASYRDLLIRNATNILNSITRYPPQHTMPIDTSSALYAAQFALASFPTTPDLQRTNLSDLTQTFLHTFEHDTNLFRSHIMPLTSLGGDALAYRNISARLLQSEFERPTPKRRPVASPMPVPRDNVTYKIGQVFRHKRAGYLAVIFGWDMTCDMPVTWIAYNNVDRLPKGRDQPFYNAYVADDHSLRYVAQENVMLLGDVRVGGTGEVVVESDVKLFGLKVGKWFRRFDYDAGVFVSNIRDEYPDD